MVGENPQNAKLELRLLGPFRVTVGGADVGEERWQRRHAKLLVQLLALQPYQRMHREQLMEVLWPEENPDSAANALNKAVHMAKRALEPGLRPGVRSAFIHTHEEQVYLSAPGGLRIDAVEFERLAAGALGGEDPAAYEAALRLYGADLLVDNLYDDWAAGPRERLRALRRDLLVGVAKIYEQRTDYHRCVERLKVASEIDRSDEEVHRALMRVYALAGSRNKAHAQYLRCRAALLEELDAEPEGATLDLYHKILSGQVQPVLPGERRRAPTFQQLTFRRGWVQAAKFGADGRRVFYAAAWGDGGLKTLWITPENSESADLGVDGAGLLSVSATDELAVSLRRRFVRGYVNTGALARVRPGGSASELLDGVLWADWAPGGEHLAVVYEVAGRCCLEYPAGRTLYETGGWISHPRFSPAGDLLAFIDHPVPADDSGAVKVVNLKGEVRTISSGWVSAQGLAWFPTGGEVWFTAAKSGNARSIHAAGLAGPERLVYRGAGTLTLHDISCEGAVLITRDHTRVSIACKTPADAEEKDLSWHDWSLARDLSADGRILLFTEAGEGGGAAYGTYLRSTDGSTALRLGDGSALALSPDGRWALVKQTTSAHGLTLLPTGSGALVHLADAGTMYQPWACWFADGERILFAANRQTEGSRLYVQHVWRGESRCMTPSIEGVELTTPHAISPDQQVVAAVGPDKRVYLYPVAGGRPTLVEGTVVDDLPVRWGQTGGVLFLGRRGRVPAAVDRLELATGRREVYVELMPADKSGVHEILRVLLSEDASTYAYSYTRDLSDLFMVTGLR